MHEARHVNSVSIKKAVKQMMRQARLVAPSTEMAGVERKAMELVHVKLCSVATGNSQRATTNSDAEPPALVEEAAVAAGSLPVSEQVPAERPAIAALPKVPAKLPTTKIAASPEVPTKLPAKATSPRVSVELAAKVVSSSEVSAEDEITQRAQAMAAQLTLVKDTFNDSILTVGEDITKEDQVKLIKTGYKAILAFDKVLAGVDDDIAPLVKAEAMELRLMKCMLLVKTGQHQRALEELTGLEKKAPEDPNVCIVHAKALLSMVGMNEHEGRPRRGCVEAYNKLATFFGGLDSNPKTIRQARSHVSSQ